MRINIDDVLAGRLEEIDKQIKIAGYRRDKQKLYRLGIERKKVKESLGGERV